MINIAPVCFLLFKVTYLLYKALYALLNLMKVSFFRKKGVLSSFIRCPGEKIAFDQKKTQRCSGVVRFDLGSIPQGQTSIGKLKSGYNSLITGSRGWGW